MSFRRRSLRNACTAWSVLALAVSAPTLAQVPNASVDQPPPAYQPQPAYPAQTYPQPAQPPRAGGFRKLFAGTVAAVADATGTALALGLTQAVTGGITNWFERKSRPRVAAAQPIYAGQQPGYVPQDPQQPMQPAYDPAAVPPTYQPQQVQPTYDPAAVSPTSQVPTYQPPVEQMPVQYYDPSTGNAASVDPAFASSTDTLYAGLAYEVHLMAPDGTTMPVNPATHEFRTGDRFVVFYRPTLPGRMEVFNINPAGQQTQIDAVEVAAAQLSRLGPYEFAATRGEEQLRLVLMPCTNPALAMATRDIVNVSDPNQPQAQYDPSQAQYQPQYDPNVQPPSYAPPALGLQGCANYATRSIRQVRTRDIRKVAVEGNTGFALDPISAQEQTSGGVAPREVTIVLHHR